MSKLTDGKGGSIAKAAQPEKGQRFIFDDHRDSPRGFGLRITAAGGRAFILKYTFEGKQRRKTIGGWPTWTLIAARDEANSLRRQIDGGVDPLQAERKRAADPTVQDAVIDYIAYRVSGLTSAKAITRYLKVDLVESVGDLKVREVRRRHIIDLVEQKARSTPTAARHLLAYSKVFFDWCLDREYLEASPAASVRPRSIAPNGRKNALKPVKRERILSHDEIRAFWIQADHSSLHLLTALALKLVLITGQRPGEVAGMHTAEIDGEIWTIPAARRGKTETDHRVPLVPLALELIGQAQAEVVRLSKRRSSEPCGLLFEARPGTALTVSAISKAVARHTAELGNVHKATWGHWRPHDLRRTARTEIAACGFPEEIAERVIGHTVKGIAGVYNQYAYDSEKRSALEAWDRRLEALIEGDFKRTTVLPFSRETNAS